MESIIKLKSRGSIENYLKKLKSTEEGKDSKTYLLKTKSPQFRVGFTDEKAKFIDPTGGPLIVVGQLLEEANSIVKSIDLVIGYGYTITFE